MQHSDERQPADSQEAGLQLFREIEIAFDGIELGDGVSLHQALAIDDWASKANIAAARAFDTEQRWQDVADEKVKRFFDTLNFMDAEGLRFYLPRFMTYAIHNEATDYDVRQAVLWQIETVNHRLLLLSERQQAAVKAFLDYFSQ